MSERSHPGQQLVRPLSAEGTPAQRPKQELDYGSRPNEGYVFEVLLHGTGEAVTDTYTSRSIANFIDFLDGLEAWIPTEVDRVYAVMDNLAAHKSYGVLLFSPAHPRRKFVFQSTYSAYLNLIEPWWKMLKSLALKDRRFLSWQEVEVAIREACAYWNSHRNYRVYYRDVVVTGEGRSVRTRLTVELVPRTCWYRNVRPEVSPSDWNKLRKETLEKAGKRCEVCGAAGRLECHEVWEYDDERRIQRLSGLVALCYRCHESKHIGLAGVRGRQEQDHFSDCHWILSAVQLKRSLSR